MDKPSSPPVRIETLAGSRPGVVVLKVHGPLEMTNFGEFEELTRRNEAPVLIVDLAEVPYIDSAEIGALVGAYATHQKDGRSLALVAVNESVRNAMEVTRVGSFFRFFDSIAAAESAG